MIDIPNSRVSLVLPSAYEVYVEIILARCLGRQHEYDFLCHVF